MRVRVHQLLVALPLTLVSALGIAVGVQSFSLESADLLSIAPADTPLPLDAVQGSVEGVVAPPPVRPARPAPALAAEIPPAAPTVKGITGFTAPGGGATPVSIAPVPKVKPPLARAARPRSRAPGRNPDCVPADPTIHSLPIPHGSARPDPRERSVSGPSAGTPLVPGSVPARNSTGLPGRGSPVTGVINGPSTSRPGASTSGQGPSVSKPSTSRIQSGSSDGAPTTQTPAQDRFADAEQVGLSAATPAPDSKQAGLPGPDSEQAGLPGTTPQADGDPAARTPRADGDPAGTTPRADGDPAGFSAGTPQAGTGQVGAPGQTPHVASCNGPDPDRPGRPSRRRVPATEPVISRDGGLATPARSGW